MFKKIIDILWVIMCIYLTATWSIKAYNLYMSGESVVSFIIRILIALGFVALTIACIVKDVIPDFKRSKKEE